MTCLTLVQNVCKRLALTVPTAVVTSLDPQIMQILALANEEGQTLAEMTNWQALVKQGTFVTVATEIQGSMSTIAPGCKFIVNDTIWNLSLRFPVFGPLAAQMWAQQKAMFYQGPWNQYRVFDDQIHFVPTPPAGQNCQFEYITQNWTTSNATEFQSDTDASVLDEQIMLMGVIWRFKEAKGLDFTADMAKYQRRVADYVARETPKPILNMNTSEFGWNGTNFDMGSGVIGSTTGFLPYV